MLPTLDARLTAAAELVRPGQPVADIGCDHGKLTAVLAASGRYPKVIGADLRPGPLAKAAQTLEYAGCKDRAELRLGDGLSVLSPGEVSTIVLAGVSAQTTWEIIEKSFVGICAGRAAPRDGAGHPPQRAAPLAVGTWFLLRGRPAGAGGGPLVCGHGSRVHRRGENAHVPRVPVRPHRPVAGGGGYAAWQKAKLPRLRLGVPDGTELAKEMDELIKGESKA